MKNVIDLKLLDWVLGAIQLFHYFILFYFKDTEDCTICFFNCIPGKNLILIGTDWMYSIYPNLLQVILTLAIELQLYFRKKKKVCKGNCFQVFAKWSWIEVLSE